MPNDEDHRLPAGHDLRHLFKTFFVPACREIAKSNVGYQEKRYDPVDPLVADYPFF